jgi:hypothetical protein
MVIFRDDQYRSCGPVLAGDHDIAGRALLESATILETDTPVHGLKDRVSRVLGRMGAGSAGSKSLLSSLDRLEIFDQAFDAPFDLCLRFLGLLGRRALA